MRRSALLAIAVLILAGCAATAPATKPTPTSTAVQSAPASVAIGVIGAVALGKGAVIHDLPKAGQCTAHSEYTDIEEGVQVSILDSSGAIVALAKLGPGTTDPAGDCIWTFVAQAPAGGKFYSAKVLNWKSDQVAEADLATEILKVLPAG